MKMIAAADKYWGIGKDSRLLVSIPADMRFFRETTMGHVIVLGRKTLETFPKGAPLPGRTNVVMTTKQSFQADGAVITHSIEETLKILKKYNNDDIYVVGGESVYRELLPYCDTAYITRIDKAYEADAHFPDLDADKDWKAANVSEEQTYFDLIYRFYTYVRIQQ